MIKKLENIWECSRMILPEHKNRIIYDNNEQERREKPILDLQEIERFEKLLYRSMEEHSPITLTLFDPIENILVRGIVMKLDKQQGIKLRCSVGEWDWFKMENVIAITT
ncbi:YolD-like protein [compost metagenome]